MILKVLIYFPFDKLSKMLSKPLSFSYDTRYLFESTTHALVYRVNLSLNSALSYYILLIL